MGNLCSFLWNKQKPSTIEVAWLSVCITHIVRKFNRAKKRTYTNQFDELLTVKKKAGS